MLLARPTLRWASTCLALALASGCGTIDRPLDVEGTTASVDENLVRAFETEEAVNVIVNLRDGAADLAGAHPDDHRRFIRRVGDEVVASHASGFALSRRFEHVPALAGRLSRGAIDRLSRDPNVSYIQIDGQGGGALTVAVPAIGGNMAKSMFGLSGKGIRVAVLDSGVNTGHPDLASSVLSTQHCFTQNACPPNNVSEGTSAEDDNGHGSHVAGIITSDGEVAGAGFAPDAEVIAVKVNDRTDSGFVSDWVAGLDWIYSNLPTLKVKIVNLSICSTALYSGNCDAAEPAMATAVKHLVDAGVVLFAASGNRGSSTQMSAPACNTGVVAVGATYKSNQGRQPTLQEGATFQARWGTTFAACFDATTAFDKVACFTNSGPRLDLLAPGAVVISDFLGSGTDNFRGTSQASPAAAGVAALMLQCRPSLTPAEVKDILQRTGVPVADTRNGRSYPSIRAFEAVRMACSNDGGAPLDAGRDALVDADQPANDADRTDALDARVDVGGPKDGASDGAPVDAKDTGTQPTAGDASPSDASETLRDGEAGPSAGAGGNGGRADGSFGPTSSAATTGSGVAGAGTAGAGAAGAGAAGAGAAGAGAAGAGGGRAMPPADDGAGCSCRAVGAPRSRAGGVGAIAVLALVARARRRTRTPRRGAQPDS